MEMEILPGMMLYVLDKSATPKIIFGLTLNGAWKGWDLNVFFQGQADAEQLVQPTMNMATDFYEGRWIETNTAEQKCHSQNGRVHSSSRHMVTHGMV